MYSFVIFDSIELRPGHNKIHSICLRNSNIYIVWKCVFSSTSRITFCYFNSFGIFHSQFKLRMRTEGEVMVMDRRGNHFPFYILRYHNGNYFLNIMYILLLLLFLVV